MVNTLSVVIPFYNEKPALIRCLQSIARIDVALIDHQLKTLAAPINWIFVDGGSTDGGPELVSKLGYSCLTAPKGRAYQMNAGANAANSDWLIFLHVDTLLDDTFFTAFNRITPATQWGYFRLKLACEQPIYRLIERSIAWRAKVWRFITGDQTLLIRKAHFLLQGGFADMALMEDVELTRKLYKHSPPVILDASVATSARKWQCKGAIKTVLFMWWIQLMYRMRVHPDTLHRWYYRDALSAKPHKDHAVISKTTPAIHQTKSAQTIVVQLAKAPLDNYVKTRLSPVLSPEQRLNLHKAMITQVIIDTQQAPVAVIESTLPSIRSHQLWVSHKHAFFEQLAQKYTTRLHMQRGNSLGERLTYCVQKSLPIASNVILIGSDCVSLTPTRLDNVCAALNQHDAVVVPATDGGFVLLGLSRWHSELFDDIEWGTASVLEQLLSNLQKVTFTYTCFDALHDIDRPEDLSRLPDAMRASIA